MYDSSIYRPQFLKKDVEVLKQQSLYQGFVQVELVSLHHRLFKDQNFNTTIQREIVRRREAAGVFVYDPALKKCLLIEQFRAGAMNLSDTPWQLEIIAGLIDAGEDGARCVQREALEEAGCHLENVRLIQSYHTSTGASDEILHFYAATADLSQCGGIHGEVSEGEDIKVHLFHYHDLSTLLQQGYLRNAAVLIAVQWFQHFLMQQDVL